MNPAEIPSTSTYFFPPQQQQQPQATSIDTTILHPNGFIGSSDPQHNLLHLQQFKLPMRPLNFTGSIPTQHHQRQQQVGNYESSTPFGIASPQFPSNSPHPRCNSSLIINSPQTGQVIQNSMLLNQPCSNMLAGQNNHNELPVSALRSPPQQNNGFMNSCGPNFNLITREQMAAFAFTSEMANEAVQTKGSLVDWFLSKKCGSLLPSTSASQQQQHAIPSPNGLRTINYCSTNGRSTKRKMQQMSEQQNLTPSPHSNYGGQPQSVPSYAGDGMHRMMTDCAPMSAPDSSIIGEFRRPPSLNHPTEIIGSFNSVNNNYLSPEMTHGNEDPLKKMEMMTSKCEPTNKVARHSIGSDEYIPDSKESRDMKLSKLDAIEKKLMAYPDPDRDQMALQHHMGPIPNGVRPSIPVNHQMIMTSEGGSVPSHQFEQMQMLSRHPSMAPTNGPFQNNGPMQLPHIYHEMVPSMRPNMQPMPRLPLTAPQQMMTGPHQASNSMVGMNMIHSPRFMQSGPIPGMQAPSMNSTSPMYQQSLVLSRMNGLPSSDQFQPSQLANGMIRPPINAPINANCGMNGDPFPWPQQMFPQPQSLANLETRVPSHRMQYFPSASTPNNIGSQQVQNIIS